MTADDVEDELHGLVEARLRRVDQRYTAGRRAIIEMLVGAGRPVSIGDIADLYLCFPAAPLTGILWISRSQVATASMCSGSAQPAAERRDQKSVSGSTRRRPWL